MIVSEANEIMSIASSRLRDPDAGIVCFVEALTALIGMRRSSPLCSQTFTHF
jgi:hypothetical protein